MNDAPTTLDRFHDAVTEARINELNRQLEVANATIAKQKAELDAWPARCLDEKLKTAKRERTAASHKFTKVLALITKTIEAGLPLSAALEPIHNLFLGPDHEPSNH